MDLHCNDAQLIQFLHEELAISQSEIDVAIRHRNLKCGPLSMILWQYGLISIDQLAQIFDWTASQSQVQSRPVLLNETIAPLRDSYSH